MQNLPNIEFSTPVKNPTVETSSEYFEVPFYKDVEYFSHLENFVGFVKAVEKVARRSKYYERYKSYIMQDLGLNYCQVLSNITVEEAPIEMHHGPILTLFDYAAIITDYLIVTEDPHITTFRVADILLEEHFNNNIQIVMLSETVHEAVHTNDIFISSKQAFGNITNFLEKYRAGLNGQQITKINRYIELSSKNDSFDNDVLTLYKTVRKWNREHGED